MESIISRLLSRYFSTARNCTKKWKFVQSAGLNSGRVLNMVHVEKWYIKYIYKFNQVTRIENCQWMVGILRGKYFFSRDTRECKKTIVRFKYQPGLKGRKWIFRRVDKKKKREKRKTGIIGTNEADNKLIFTGLIWMSKRTVCIRNPFIGNNDQNMSKYKKHVCWLAVKLCLPIFEYIRVLFSPLPDIFI